MSRTERGDEIVAIAGECDAVMAQTGTIGRYNAAVERVLNLG
jgi:hypothetical protein